MEKQTLRATEYLDEPLRALGELLSPCGSVTAGVPGSRLRTFLDTFDGRVLKSGWVLEARGEGAGAQLELREAADGALLGTAAVPPGRFVWDVQPGRLRAKLEPVVEVRALLPLVRVRSTTQDFEVRNRDDKLVLKVFREEHLAASAGGDTWRPLPPRVRLEPVRGYRREARKAAMLLERAGGAQPCEEPLLRAALEAVGTPLPDYSSKIRVALRPDQAAEGATRAILLHLLGTMRANEEGTLLDLDSEFLHDFRVAVRRTRSALGQIKGVFPAEFLAHFRGEFAWLGGVTGPARDLDVYLLSLPAYRDMLPRPLRADLDPLEDLLRGRQRKEQRRVARALRSRRYARLVESWRKALAAPVVSGASPPPDASRPVVEVATERIRKVFRRVLKEGGAIQPDSAPVEFHELRKTCKKLRYLLEFFESLYAPGRMKAVIRALKELQDNLGEYQDLSVQIASMRRFEDELGRSAASAATTLRAIEVLVDAFRRRQDEVRAEFAERFAAFSAAKLRDGVPPHPSSSERRGTG